jgi:hypothetical protein
LRPEFPSVERRRVSFGRTWLTAWLLLSGIMVCWSVASPLLSAGDEPAHIKRAASLYQGELLGTAVHGPHARYTPASTLVHVPGTYAQTGLPQFCFEGNPNVPAGCAHLPVTSDRTKTIDTPAGRYPPLYFALVGWPSRLTTQLVGFYLMRTASALISAAFIALAFATARRWSPSTLLAPAIAVAATPTTIYLASVVNPNGLEITAAIAMWTAGVVAVRSTPKHPPRLLVAILAVSAMVTISQRSISLLWPLLMVLILLPVAWRRLDWKAWFRDRWVRGWAAAAVIVAALNGIWLVVANGLAVDGIPQHLPLATTVRHTTSMLPHQYEEAIGYFGWRDTPAPWLTWQFWVVMGAVLIAVGLLFGTRPWVTSLLLAVAAGVLVPIVLMTIEAPKAGYISQGRYYLPLLAGIPLVAAGSVGERVPRHALWRITVFLAIGVAAAQLLCFWWTLHRFLVGMTGPLFGFGHTTSAWHPPVPWYVLDVVFLLLCVTFAGYLIRAVELRPRSDATRWGGGAEEATSPLAGVARPLP